MITVSSKQFKVDSATQWRRLANHDDMDGLVEAVKAAYKLLGLMKLNCSFLTTLHGIFEDKVIN